MSQLTLSIRCKNAQMTLTDCSVSGFCCRSFGVFAMKQNIIAADCCSDSSNFRWSNASSTSDRCPKTTKKVLSESRTSSGFAGFYSSSKYFGFFFIGRYFRRFYSQASITFEIVRVVATLSKSLSKSTATLIFSSESTISGSRLYLMDSTITSTVSSTTL